MVKVYRRCGSPLRNLHELRGVRLSSLSGVTRGNERPLEELAGPGGYLTDELRVLECVVVAIQVRRIVYAAVGRYQFPAVFFPRNSEVKKRGSSCARWI